MAVVPRPYRCCDRGDIDAAAELTPALLVLNNLVQASEGSRMAVKKAIFPPQADQVKTDLSMRNTVC